MQQSGHQRFLVVEFHLGQNTGHRYRVRDIGVHRFERSGPRERHVQRAYACRRRLIWSSGGF